MTHQNGNGPKLLGESLARLQAGIEARHRKRVEAAARPGETFEQAETRLRAEDAAREQEEAQAKAKARAAALAASAERERKEAAAKAAPSSVRKPPSGDEQADFFVPSLYDVGGRDNRSIMDVAVFRLSKRDKRAGEMIRYELPDGFVEVTAGPYQPSSCKAKASRHGMPIKSFGFKPSGVSGRTSIARAGFFLSGAR